MTYSEKEIAKNTAILGLLQGKDESGNSVYCYLAVPGEKYQEFAEKQKSGASFNPLEYGVVLEAGPGEPSETVKAYMTEKYGFDHESGVISLPNGSSETN